MWKIGSQIENHTHLARLMEIYFRVPKCECVSCDAGHKDFVPHAEVLGIPIFGGGYGFYREDEVV
jgi:hypothetical protein